MKHRTLLLVALVATACKGEPDDRTLPDTDTDTDTGVDTDTGTDTDTDTSPVGPTGFVGGPCEDNSDCAYEGGVCLTEAQGFPGGMCSLPCDRLCPDEPGYPVTFCVTDDDIPEADFDPQGACMSRCDFGVFPDTGCRTGYGCAVAARESEPGTQRYVCLPNTASDLSDCQLELAARGVSFEPTLRADEHPSTHPGLTCHIEDPVFLRPPIHGVRLSYYDGVNAVETPSMLMSCEGAHATVDTIDDLAAHGVDEILHIGTYNCRVISGTNTLSRHAYGDAIDIWGVELSNGASYSLYDDWVHDAHPPPADNEGARFLYDAAYRWYDGWYWSYILTPNFNAAHDNHFHLDKTPGVHSILSLGAAEAPYIGPLRHDDCGGPAFAPEN